MNTKGCHTSHRSGVELAQRRHFVAGYDFPSTSPATMASGFAGASCTADSGDEPHYAGNERLRHPSTLVQGVRNTIFTSDFWTIQPVNTKGCHTSHRSGVELAQRRHFVAGYDFPSTSPATMASGFAGAAWPEDSCKEHHHAGDEHEQHPVGAGVPSNE